MNKESQPDQIVATQETNQEEIMNPIISAWRGIQEDPTARIRYSKLTTVSSYATHVKTIINGGTIDDSLDSADLKIITYLCEIEKNINVLTQPIVEKNGKNGSHNS